MTQHRALLLAILVYVSLDLSLPGMPGAFVFEPSETVDSAQGRGRATADMVIVLGSVGYRVLPPLTITSDDRPLPSSGGNACVTCPAVKRLPRAVPEPARPADDPH